MLARPAREVGQFRRSRRGAGEQDRCAVAAAGGAIGIAIEQRAVAADKGVVADEQAVAVILQRLAVRPRKREALPVRVVSDAGGHRTAAFAAPRERPARGDVGPRHPKTTRNLTATETRSRP